MWAVTSNRSSQLEVFGHELFKHGLLDREKQHVLWMEVISWVQFPSVLTTLRLDPAFITELRSLLPVSEDRKVIKGADGADNRKQFLSLRT